MTSIHKVHYKGAQDLSLLDDQSVDLVVTSPPYPMIEMWDEVMMQQNEAIRKAFKKGKYTEVYEGMHKELDKVWLACHRVLKEGGIACINIGDATRTLDENFVLYPNHARIIQSFLTLGYQNLPNILWRKRTNAPNKFMGSGMLPPSAYVTLEHEYILIFRKGRKRTFDSTKKLNRQQSSYFWEERNIWFSDLWEVKGTTQKLTDNTTRERSAAYPFEIPYRLINMFSVQGDTVLDPFLGTGTTTLAAMAANRDSIGFEINENFPEVITKTLIGKEDFLNNILHTRLSNHKKFVENRLQTKGKDAFKYQSQVYGFPVVTRQEINIEFPLIKKITVTQSEFHVDYFDKHSMG